MNLRKFLKLMVPQIIPKIFEARLRYRHFLGPFNNYKRAFTHVKLNAFESEVWQRHTRSKLLTKTLTNNRILPQHQAILAALIGQLSMRTFSNDGPIKIVDWGGGGGELYDVVTSAVPSKKNLNYIVVDNSRLIELGKVFRPNIKFFDSMNEGEIFDEAKDADILFMSSVLHYIPQWQSFLKRIISDYRSNLLYIARHYSPDALDTPVFATQKIYTGLGYAGETVLQLLPEKIISELLSNRYRLVISTINNIPGYFPPTFDALNIRERNILYYRNN